MPRLNLRTARSAVLFVFGLAGFAHETIVAHAERPTLLIIFTGMVGMPTVLGFDERRKAVARSDPRPEPAADGGPPA